MEPFNYISVKETSSTNDHLKHLIKEEEELPEGIVVQTSNQTQGKGQTGNSWESEADKNLTFSLLLRPEFLPASSMFLISKIISLAIIDCFDKTEKVFTIKWPNDIYYQDKKIGGILIENQLLGNTIAYSVVGIGLNINQTVFTSDAPNPISLKQITGKEHKLHKCLESILQQISIWYEMLSEGFSDKINQAYLSHLFRKADFHDFKDEKGTFHAQIVDVADDGKIKLKTPDGSERGYYFKEVEFII